ncbi:unnamed protein product [Mycena citricolor]|uniref:Beta-glucuronidase C-terminal domain-containing protein n=1 Tax=Mycena citricolor TaxID=2018698 RepID=A0AAD2Q0J6_9AGAR|nr:unnamed protein product [Mycena citricolor]
MNERTNALATPEKRCIGRRLCKGDKWCRSQTPVYFFFLFLSPSLPPTDPPRMWLAASLFPTLLLFSLPVCAKITVYGQIPLGKMTTTTASASASASASYTGLPAFDPTTLIAPPVPTPAPPTSFFQQLSSAPVPGLSIPQSGHFMGFSVEFSVINQVLGSNSTRLMVPFLNLMANVQARAGSVRIRVGGNTQDYAVLEPSLPSGKMLGKESQISTNPTKTPILLYTPDVLYMLANVSSLVNVEWYLGIPLNDTTNLRLQIAEVGNEPDQYALHQHRPQGYGPANYSADFGVVDTALRADSKVPVVNGKLMGPSLSGQWQPQSVWDTNFIQDFQQSLGALSMSFYPDNNCAAEFGGPSAPNAIVPQDVFSDYLNHTSGQAIAANYLTSTALAQTFKLPFVMVETNTASCGGFPGISDSFGASLWAVDYGLQLAYSNFTNALLHVGGQGVYYNPFTPPPTNETAFHSWTIGAVYYSVLVIAEAFGKSNQSQIIDLQTNSNNIYTPAYAIYDGGVLARLALFNYVSDPSGASDYTMSFAIGGGSTGQANGTPAQVKVKYLLAPSVSTQDNITWAGQTFGSAFASDGRMQGTEQVQTVTCNGDNTCNIKVPAPGFALVFLTDIAADPASYQTVQTFPTTALTKTVNTATLNPTVLATSNGQAGANFMEAGTSRGRKPSGAGRLLVPHLVVVALCMGLGAALVVLG